MNIVQILVLAILSVMLVTITRNYRPEFASLIVMASGIAFFTYICTSVINIFDYFRSLCNYVGINIVYIEVMFKVVGVSYICEFVSSVCKDAGESSIAVKVDLAGKLVILSSSLPVFKELIELIVNVAT